MDNIQEILDTIMDMPDDNPLAAELKGLREEFLRKARKLDVETVLEERTIRVEVVYINGKKFDRAPVERVICYLNGGTGFRAGVHLSTLSGPAGEHYPVLAFLADNAVIDVGDDAPVKARRGPNYKVLADALGITIWDEEPDD